MNSIRAVIEYNIKGVIAYMADENLAAIDGALERVEEITDELRDAHARIERLSEQIIQLNIERDTNTLKHAAEMLRLADLAIKYYTPSTDYEKMLKIIDGLIDFDPEYGTPEYVFLDRLSKMISDYEKKAYPLGETE